MRIRRLDLTRYGKFTNRSFDFGDTRPGLPDLHILYGPNEAGKSTTLAAWLDLLFGIEPQTRYSFLHPGPTMRIGAVLQIGGKELSVVRVKTRANALLDSFDAPIPQAVLQGGLSGLSRASYQAMFSLDDDTLVEGGESILASQGDLGELLFSTSAGLTGLSQRLKTLQTEADAFLKPPRSGRLFDLKNQLGALEDARKAIDVQAPDYARRADAVTTADLAWQAAIAALASANSDLERLKRVDAGRALASRLAGLSEKLAATVDAPTPPAEWGDELKDLIADKTAAAAKAEILRASIQRLTQRLAQNPVDQAGLDLAGPIAEADALRSAHDEAVKDLPARSDALRDEEVKIGTLMARLGRPGQPPDALLLPSARVPALRSLIASHSGLRTAVATAGNEADDAVAQSQDADARLAEAGGLAANTDALAILLAALKARDPAHALRQAGALTLAAQSALADRLAALTPWQGTAQTLSAQTVPSHDRLLHWSQRAEAARRAVIDAGAEARRLKADHARQLAVLDARAASGRLSPDDLAAARSERERLWALHLAALAPQTATAFEAAMRRDDLLTANRAAIAAEQAVQAQTREAVAIVTAELAGAEAALAQAEAAASALALDWTAQLRTISASLPTTWGAMDLRAWLDLREQALKAGADLARLDGAQRLAAAEVTAAAADLRAALPGAAGPPAHAPSFDALFAAASALVDAGGKRAGLAEAAATQRRIAQRRCHDLASAEAAATAWHADWTALCRDTWLATEAAPDPSAAAQAIEIIEDLRAALTAQHGLADRVAKMHLNRAAFRATVAATLGQEVSDPTAAWHALTRRLRLAEDARAAADKDTADLDGHSAQLAAQDDVLRLKDQRLRSMADTLGLDDVDAMRDALAAAAERVQWQKDIAAVQDDLVQTTRSASLDAALATINAVAGADLDALLSAATSAAGAAQDATQTRFAAVSKARDDLESVGGDDAAARLDAARQTILVQIADDALRHLRQRFGIIAVEHALRAYRDCHQSAMMARASAAFQTISRGAYTGLDSQFEKDREVLVALAADGSSKLAPDLSKGTRFQLYLALRAAGYHVLAEVRPPVPFIADDIMETFDDDRSAEAFALLGDMAQVGQVIYLTHHRHLCDIARQVCPDARIQEFT